MRATTLTIEFHNKFNKYPKAKAKILKAEEFIETQLNSEEFKKFILGHTFQEELQFADTALSNEEVYKTIMGGKEILSNELDYELDVILIPYYSRKRVIGYTYPSRKEIWVNMRYYNKANWSEADVAGNLTHEPMHKLGFKHSHKRSWRWPYTVPYAVGNWMKKQVSKELGKLHLEEVETTGLKHMGFFTRVFYKVINFIF